MVHLFATFAPFIALGHVVLAACPMAELARRGAAPQELIDLYKDGKGLSDEHFRQAHGQASHEQNSRQLRPGASNSGDGHDGPALLDPVSGLLSPLGLGSLVPRRHARKHGRQLAPGGSNSGDGHDGPALLDPVSALLSPLGAGALVPREGQLTAAQRAHIKARRDEPSHLVDIDAAVLTPKAAKRHFQKRGLIGGLLSPLTGPLQALDLPTPQDSGLKAIPGDDPNHQYKAPGPTDVRGNCPTLNTLANHGYLDRSGITTFAEAANAIQTAYSMSFDIAIVLSAFGLLAGGDLLTGRYSIAGQDGRVLNTIGPAYGIDRHGTFELDGSISRSDKGLGDNHSFNVSKWNDLVQDANKYGNGYFSIEAFKRNAADQAKKSRATNPEYSNGANFIFNGATRALTLRPLPNGTTPDVADWANIAPFFLNETFPDGWFRRPNSYSFVDLLGDAADILLFDLQPLGRNEGGRFVPNEVNLPTVARDLGCAGFSILANAIPGQLAPEFTLIGQAVLDQILAPIFGSAGCSLQSFNEPGLSNNGSNQGNVTSESGSGVTGKGQHQSVYRTKVFSGTGDNTVYQDTGYNNSTS